LLSDHTTSYVHGEDHPPGLVLQYSGIGLWGRRYGIAGPTTVHYALVPHSGRWDHAGISAESAAWTEPLVAVWTNPHGRTTEDRKSMLDLTGSGWEVSAMTVEGKSLLVRVFNAAGDGRARQLSLDGRAVKAALLELNRDVRETLRPIVEPDGRTSLRLAIPRFGLRTIKFDETQAPLGALPDERTATQQVLSGPSTNSQAPKPLFKVLAFYTGTNDRAHISFVGEANRWFPKAAEQYHFSCDATNDWSLLKAEFLLNYQVVVFLDTRPEKPEQRAAFEQYMKNGGAWLGFHFAGFALTPSGVPQNWDWYHNEFLGSGSYAGNTWQPTRATLRVEDRQHPATQNLPETFVAAPNEWYKWANDLRKNPNIRILLSIDPISFPLGTGPKPHEIWHEGYYPVVWANKNYRMIYVNMGHNDIDYENKTNQELSFTFKNQVQNKLIIDSLLWLGRVGNPVNGR
jgi:hypothetical protein